VPSTHIILLPILCRGFNYNGFIAQYDAPIKIILHFIHIFVHNSVLILGSFHYSGCPIKCGFVDTGPYDSEVLIYSSQRLSHLASPKPCTEGKQYKEHQYLFSASYLQKIIRKLEKRYGGPKNSYLKLRVYHF
jgi:hypothetical protein